jgi:hypothetical protein
VSEPEKNKYLTLRVCFPSGGSTSADLLQALEDYLPVLLGLVKEGKYCIFSSILLRMRPNKSVLIVVAFILVQCLTGSNLEDKIQFSWMNQEDDAEVCLPCPCQCMFYGSIEEY